ncbi:uncharacterized protein [Antedon mediterranea]|uniref:uncharacterized protein n=1 Tax=Antedon mediterranea TaxID=105859 RepID=UPI003AF862BD
MSDYATFTGILVLISTVISVILGVFKCCVRRTTIKQTVRHEDESDDLPDQTDGLCLTEIMVENTNDGQVNDDSEINVNVTEQNVHDMKSKQTIEQLEEGANTPTDDTVATSEEDEVNNESGISETDECGYSTIDELSEDDDDEKKQDEGLYHHIEDVSSQTSDTSDDSDNMYADIKELFELPAKPNYYLSLCVDSDDEDSDIYHNISPTLSEDGSEHNYTTIEEWSMKSTETLCSSIAISEDDTGYLIVTHGEEAFHKSTESLNNNNENTQNKDEIHTDNGN